MRRNVFVLGLDDFNRAKLEALEGAEALRFHGLIEPGRLKNAASYDFRALLAEARERLAAFDGPVDAIVNFWDFPASALHPILCREHGLPGPTLDAVLCATNKGLSRRAQREVAPDLVPGFTVFDPFADDPLAAIELDYPFWVKPVQSYSGYLGFRIGGRADFERHLATIRANIGRYAEPYAALLEDSELDPSVTGVSAHHCIAEAIIGGKQCTVEGWSDDGEVTTYGIIDSFRYPNRVSFSRYHYPSVLPRRVQARIREAAATVIRHLGLDRSAFNIEFFYDAEADDLRLLEINSRISQSHAELFEKVDGAPNHRPVVDLALGGTPRMPHREGRYNCAAKIFARRFRDARVARAPGAEDVARAEERVPDTRIVIPVREGMRLSDLLDQDSYSYQYALVYLGGRDRRDMLRGYKHVLEALPFEFE